MTARRFLASFSYRRLLTIVAAGVFVASTVAYLLGAPELPAGYQAIIAGVFAFYFAKDRLRRV